eukprot:235381-Alexandrium_andersonii.AAC.1
MHGPVSKTHSCNRRSNSNRKRLQSQRHNRTHFSCAWGPARRIIAGTSAIAIAGASIIAIANRKGTAIRNH